MWYKFVLRVTVIGLCFCTLKTVRMLACIISIGLKKQEKIEGWQTTNETTDETTYLLKDGHFPKDFVKYQSKIIMLTHY